MFVLLKKDSDNTEIIYANSDEDTVLNRFVDTVINSASNGDEYTCGDIEAIKEQRYERVGPYLYKVYEFPTLSIEKFLQYIEGNCPHCHSIKVTETSLDFIDGKIERKITCEICNTETTFVYSASENYVERCTHCASSNLDEDEVDMFLNTKGQIERTIYCNECNDNSYITFNLSEIK